MLNQLYLGLDIGTSGVRGICINEALEIIAVAKVTAKNTDRLSLRNPASWKEMVNQVFASLSKEVSLNDILSISVDGQSGTVLLCDNNGSLFEETSLLYNDNPSESSKNELNHLIGMCPPSLGRALSLWKTQGKPQEFQIIHQADWIAGLLCNCFNQSDENNTLKMGYSPQQQKWSFDKTKLPFDDNALPLVSIPADLKGYAITPYAKNLGLNQNCRIVSGTTDGTAGFIAAAGLQQLASGTAVTSLGTTLIIKNTAASNIQNEKFGVYSHKLFNVWIAGGASNSGAGILLDYFSPKQLRQLSRMINPSLSTPLKYYPLLVKGERFPIHNSEMLSQVEPRPDDDSAFLAGLFESIARIEKQAYEVLDSLGAPYPNLIQTVGGGSQNEVWTAIRERVLGVKVKRAEQTEAAYGSALIAHRGSLG